MYGHNFIALSSCETKTAHFNSLPSFVSNSLERNKCGISSSEYNNENSEDAINVHDNKNIKIGTFKTHDHKSFYEESRDLRHNLYESKQILTAQQNSVAFQDSNTNKRTFHETAIQSEFFSDSVIKGMSRRKQNKPRHLADEDDGNCVENEALKLQDSPLITGGLSEGKKEEVEGLLKRQDHNTEAQNQVSSTTNTQRYLTQTDLESTHKPVTSYATSASLSHISESPVKPTSPHSDSGVNDIKMNGSVEKTPSIGEPQEDITPPHKMNGVIDTTSTPLGTYRSMHPPIGRGPAMSSLLSSSPREDSQLNHHQGIHHAYFRGLSAQETGSTYSDEDADIPSDIDSNEPNEAHDLHKEASESGFVEGSSGIKTQTDEEGTDSNRSGNSGNSDDATDKDHLDADNSPKAAAAVGGVTLQTLDTTKVAVAQVVDEDKEDDVVDDDGDAIDDDEDKEMQSNPPAIPSIQQVLYTLQQQQMFQLHILQQIQTQVAKYASGLEEGNSETAAADLAAIAAMMNMSWLRNGLGSNPAMAAAAAAVAAASGRNGSGGSSGDDVISENSDASGTRVNEDFVDEERFMDNGNLEVKLDEGCKNDSRRSSPLLNGFSGKLNGFEDMGASPILRPGVQSSLAPPPSLKSEDRIDTESGNPDSSIPPPPLPHRFPPQSMNSFMPGFNPFSSPPVSNPLLPSNLFNPSRMPMFRPFFPPPPPEDEDSMEEFMEIEKTESSKLEELVKKMEPHLKDPNQCAICKRILSCKSALQMHYRTHTGERPFKCKICGRAFTTKGNLKTHMSVHRTRPSGQMHHQCPVCSKQFSNILLLQEHVRMHVGDMNQNGFPKMPPLPPNFMMPFAPMMPLHMQAPSTPKLSPAGDLELSRPPSQFQDDFPLRSTENRSSPGKEVPMLNGNGYPHKRPAEEEEFNEAKKQKEDSEPKADTKKYKENDLVSDKNDASENVPSPHFGGGSLFALQKSVKEMDRLMHTPSHPMGLLDPFRYSTTPMKDPSEHRDSHQNHPGTPGTPQSIKMEPTMHHSSSASVISHTGSQAPLPASRPIVPASGPSPPACPTSPFRKRESLRHVCSVCHKPFSSGSALQIHMRTHTGERPFKCTVCGKGFTTKGNLKVHMSTHACQSGPPRRGRRMSMDTLPPFGSPSQYPSLPPRPPMSMAGFPHMPPPGSAAFNGLLMSGGKGLPSSIMPPVFPGFMFDRHRPLGGMLGGIGGGGIGGGSGESGAVSMKERRSVSPTPHPHSPNHKKSVVSSDTGENNNLQPKGMYGELDLSMRGSAPAIKT